MSLTKSLSVKLLPGKLLLGLMLLVAACTDLSGLDPNARIAVAPSFATYLPNQASKPYAQVITTALKAQKLPAVADYPIYGDWQLKTRINRGSNTATPVFELQDPGGKLVGTVEARPVSFEVWRQGQADTLRQAATEAAPRIAAMFNRVVAERRQEVEARRRNEVPPAQSRAGYDRPTRVAITAITGAPSDGNVLLDRLMREKLKFMGEVIVDPSNAPDFTLRARIDDVTVDDKTHRIEIFWLLHNAAKQEVGEIVQLEEVAAGALSKGWGKLATSVTDEAAGAVRDIILTQQGKR